MRLLNSILALSLFLIYPSDTFAKMYKWFDEKGGIHWSDRPPDTDKQIKDVEEFRPSCFEPNSIDVENDKESNEQYTSVIKTLTPNYKGDDPKKLFDKLHIDKGEFETTEGYKNRFRGQEFQTILKTDYVFKVESEKHYDADLGVLKMQLNRLIFSSLEEGGSPVKKFKKRFFLWLDISNFEIVKKKLGDSIESSFGGLFESSAKLKLNPATAEAIKKDAQILFICRLVPYTWKYPKLMDEHRFLFLNDEKDVVKILLYTSRSNHHFESLSDFGYETRYEFGYETTGGLSVKLLELVAFNDSTGEILERFGPFK